LERKINKHEKKKSALQGKRGCPGGIFKGTRGRATRDKKERETTIGASFVRNEAIGLVYSRGMREICTLIEVCPGLDLLNKKKAWWS